MSIFQAFDDSSDIQDQFWLPVATPTLNEPQLLSGLLSIPSKGGGMTERYFILTGTTMYWCSVNCT
jgi:hypothetical protein